MTNQPPGCDRPSGSSSRGRFAAAVDNAMLLVVVVLLFPFVIILIGAPIALIVRMIVEIARRL